MHIGCYYFPNYHTGDPMNDLQHGTGWSEWNLVRSATPRFPGHRQPKRPLWGYSDGKDPAVMARKIDVAASHGIGSFIFDWYYYDTGPFLNRELEEGFLQAGNRNKLKFCTMWANHPWVDIHPVGRSRPCKLLYPGVVTRKTFEKIMDIHISQYFCLENYFRMDGAPFFSIYDIPSFITGMGSVESTRRALDDFRIAARAAGFPRINLNAIICGAPIVPGEGVAADFPRLVRQLGFDSIASYCWLHHFSFPDHFSDYLRLLEMYMKSWDYVADAYDLEYYPNVSVGWDSTPRTLQSDNWDWKSNVGYPYTNIIVGNTPEAFGKALTAVADRLVESSQKHKMMSINAWNEWTEGAYLEPDEENGMAYLEQIRKIMGGIRSRGAAKDLLPV